MTVGWMLDDGIWYLKCNLRTCTGMIACPHTYDRMTTGSSDDLQIPSGFATLPMSGEFPAVGDNLFRFDGKLTAEQLGSFDVLVSDPINAYGTRKVEIVTTNLPVFLMMLNPEDAIVSIYQALHEFVNTQVSYTGSDRFGSCKGSGHKMSMQVELEILSTFTDVHPMLEFWDKLSKLTTNSCIVCMWKRAKPVMAGADASGLNNLDLLAADEKQTATAMFQPAENDPWNDDEAILRSFKSRGF